MPVLRNGRGAAVGRVEARGVPGRRDNPGPWRGAVAGRVGLLAVAGRVGLLLYGGHVPVHVPVSAPMPVLRSGRGTAVERVEARGVAGRRGTPGPWRGAVAGRVDLLAVAGRVGLLL